MPFLTNLRCVFEKRTYPAFSTMSIGDGGKYPTSGRARTVVESMELKDDDFPFIFKFDVYENAGHMCRDLIFYYLVEKKSNNTISMSPLKRGFGEQFDILGMSYRAFISSDTKVYNEVSVSEGMKHIKNDYSRGIFC